MGLLGKFRVASFAHRSVPHVTEVFRHLWQPYCLAGRSELISNIGLTAEIMEAVSETIVKEPEEQGGHLTWIRHAGKGPGVVGEAQMENIVPGSSWRTRRISR